MEIPRAANRSHASSDGGTISAQGDYGGVFALRTTAALPNSIS